MQFRTQKWDSSLSPIPSWKWKIQTRKIGQRLWRDHKNGQGTVIFSHVNHAENYMKILNKPVLTYLI